VLITNDVETTSILNHRLSDEAGELVYKQGMPRLLDLYSKYNIKATFFFTGYIAKLFPEVVKMVIPYGHEIGSHGLVHEVDKAFDLLNFNEQKRHLSESKKILEDISGQEIISFRAPAARVNSQIAKALFETGYKIDSSVASQRLDMFFSFGSLKKLIWLTTPRLPYYTNPNNIFRKGDGKILEIPISAFGIPYIGTVLRISPLLNILNRFFLHLETKVNNRPFVFLAHPNEFIDEARVLNEIERRSKTYLSYLFGDVIRHHLKIRNLGIKALPLLEAEIRFFKNNNFEFLRCCDLLIE
jgi:peptidoglycan-N-acetylglucosamine deacetylase